MSRAITTIPPTAARSCSNRCQASRQRPAERRPARTNSGSLATAPGITAAAGTVSCRVVAFCRVASVAMRGFLAEQRVAFSYQPFWSPRRLAASSVVDARIDRRVRQIDHEVNQDEHDGDDEDRPLNGRIIAGANCGDDVAPQARPTEDGFGQEGAG